MWTMIFRQIWNKRRSNAWLWGELFVVFVLLWYVSDYMLTAFYTRAQPKGYDTEHVYHVSMAVNMLAANDTTGVQIATLGEGVQRFVKQFAEYPGVEAACYYLGTIPYETSGIIQGYSTDSISSYIAQIQYVSRSFFEVFRVPITADNLDGWDVETYPRPAIASVDLADSLFNGHPQLGAPFFDYYEPTLHYRLSGIAPLTKQTEFARYRMHIYVPIEERRLNSSIAVIALRVRPESDVNFIERFTADNRRMRIGFLEFAQILRYDDIQAKDSLSMNNWLNSMLALGGFFLFNVLLGVLGTFWIRTRKRRAEIGLRMAMGASRRRVFTEQLGESVLLLLLAALPALLVCYNIRYADLTVNTFMDMSDARFYVGVGLTTGLMLAAVVLAVWYPARRAMMTQPTDALHEE